MSWVLIALILFSLIGIIQAFRQFAIRAQRQKRSKEMLKRFNETGNLPPISTKKWRKDSED